jgi:hypothetical protein
MMNKTKGLNIEPALRVLDAVLHEPSLWSKAQMLAPDDFFDPVHRAVFITMQTLAAIPMARFGCKAASPQKTSFAAAKRSTPNNTKTQRATIFGLSVDAEGCESK